MSKQLSWLIAVLIVDAGLAAQATFGQSAVRWNVVEMGMLRMAQPTPRPPFRRHLMRQERPAVGLSKRLPDATASVARCLSRKA